MDCCLVLTTLSGMAIHVSLSVAKFDRFEDLEDQVMDYLASVTDLAVFGCSIDFLHLATQTYLEDPIWDKLQQSKEYCIIFKDCSETLHTQELLEGCPIYNVPLAVHVPMNPEGPLQVYRDCDMSALSQASGSSVQMLGKIAGSSASSNCRPLSWAFQTMCFATANCSIVFLPQVAGCLAIKPLRSAARYNGCMQLKELPIGLVTTLSLGTTGEALCGGAGFC